MPLPSRHPRLGVAIPHRPRVPKTGATQTMQRHLLRTTGIGYAILSLAWQGSSWAGPRPKVDFAGLCNTAELIPVGECGKATPTEEKVTRKKGGREGELMLWRGTVSVRRVLKGATESKTVAIVFPVPYPQSAGGFPAGELECLNQGEKCIVFLKKSKGQIAPLWIRQRASVGSPPYC